MAPVSSANFPMERSRNSSNNEWIPFESEEVLPFSVTVAPTGTIWLVRIRYGCVLPSKSSLSREDCSGNRH